VLVLCACVYLLFITAFSAWYLVKYRGETKQPGYTVSFDQKEVRIRSVTSPRLERVLRPGDRILAVDGDSKAASIGPFFRFFELDPRSTYLLTLRRAGRDRPVSALLQLEDQEPEKLDLWYRLSLLLVTGAFAITSIVLIAFRPWSLLVRLGCVANLAGALVLQRTALAAVKYSLSGLEQWAYFGGSNINPVHLAIGFSFFSRFPHGRQLRKSARWAEILLYLVTIPLWLSADLLERATTQKAFLGSPSLLASRALSGLYTASIEAVCVVAFLLICLTLLLNYRQVVEPLERRRARWVVYGCIFGLLPWALWATAALFLRWTSLGGTANSGFMAVSGQLANLAIGVIPIVAGIAIAQNRLFEVHVVVRRGVQYLLARSVLQAALTTPVVVLGIFVYLGRHRTLVEIVFQNSALFYIAASSAMGLLFRKQLQEWLDRRFFRSSYDREKLLMSLSDEIRHLDSPEQVADLVIQRIEEALHPGTVVVVIASPGQPEPRVFASEGVVQPTSGASGLLTLFDDAQSPVTIPKESDPPADHASWLDQIAVELAVPLRPSRNRLTGLLLLGPKRSEEPYGEKDLELLLSLGTQMALVYENLALQEDVEVERSQKLKLIEQFEERGDVVKECENCGRCFDGGAERCSFDGGSLRLSLPVSRLLADRYRLDRLIGKGGMGAVYEATDQRLERTVAVKIAVGDVFTKREVLGRFEREARAAARLSHPNIIAVFDYGTIAGRGAYLVMELIIGRTLRTELNERTLLPPSEVAPLLGQLLSGLQAAHTNGIIHRDLKPENILLSTMGDGKTVLKILDFGLAKTSLFDFSTPTTLTTPGMVVGTAGYMSPEQICGDEVDLRSDLFSAGVLAFEALTGQLPFRGSTMRELMLATITDSFELPITGPGMVRLLAVFERALARNLDKRFASSQEMLEILVPAIRAVPDGLIPPPVEKRSVHSQSTLKLV
jgi:hypothetical protein